MASDIYGDLPDNERLTGWRPLYPAELLHRYNIALVQGLLVYADDLEVTAADSNPAELRRLFKYLRFFRLLAEIRRLKPKGKGKVAVGMKISGPFSIFANTRKYALQLAAFFPALVNLESWSLSAEIRLDGQRGGAEARPGLRPRFALPELLKLCAGGDPDVSQALQRAGVRLEDRRRIAVPRRRRAGDCLSGSVVPARG